MEFSSKHIANWWFQLQPIPKLFGQAIKMFGFGLKVDENDLKAPIIFCSQL